MASGIGVTVSSGLAVAKPNENSSLVAEEILRSSIVQRILDSLQSPRVIENEIETAVYDVGGNRVESMTLPTEVGKITYTEGEEDGKRESAAQFQPSHPQAYDSLAREFGSKVRKTESVLWSYDGDAVLSREPTPEERQGIERTIDGDDFEAYTTSEIDGFQVYVRNGERSDPHRVDVDRSRSFEHYRVIPPENSEGHEWTINPTTQSHSCTHACMQCCLGLTVSIAGVAGCMTGQWIICASGLIGGGIITYVKCPDCYECAK